MEEIMLREKSVLVLERWRDKKFSVLKGQLDLGTYICFMAQCWRVSFMLISMRNLLFEG